MFVGIKRKIEHCNPKVTYCVLRNHRPEIVFRGKKIVCNQTGKVRIQGFGGLKDHLEIFTQLGLTGAVTQPVCAVTSVCLNSGSYVFGYRACLSVWISGLSFCLSVWTA